MYNIFALLFSANIVMIMLIYLENKIELTVFPRFLNNLTSQNVGFRVLIFVDQYKGYIVFIDPIKKVNGISITKFSSVETHLPHHFRFNCFEFGMLLGCI